MRLTPLPQASRPNWPQRPKPVKMQIRRRHIICFALVTLLVSFGWLTRQFSVELWGQIEEKVLLWSAKQGLGLKYILVEGRKNLREGDLHNALNLYQGMPLLSIDLEGLRERLMQAPWVREATITRLMPDKLRIEIKEAEPFALWQQGNTFTLIDQTGKSIGGVEPARYPQLWVIAGEGAPGEAATFFNMLKNEEKLFQRIRSATLISHRRWNIRFDNQIEVKLPETEWESAWAMLGKLEREQKILDRAISSIDLRLPDKVFIEMPSSPLISTGSKENSI